MNIPYKSETALNRLSTYVPNTSVTAKIKAPSIQSTDLRKTLRQIDNKLRIIIDADLFHRGLTTKIYSKENKTDFECTNITENHFICA